MSPRCLSRTSPYNVAATIILQFFQMMPALQRAVVMVQKEVADRLPQRRATRPWRLRQSWACMRRLRVALRCRRVALCRRRTWTRPSCVSTVLTAWCPKDSTATLARVIDAAFAQRRKTIRNSMSANGCQDVLDAAFEACGIALHHARRDA